MNKCSVKSDIKTLVLLLPEESFEYFCQISSKSILIISSYTIGAFFFDTQCINNKGLKNVKKKAEQSNHERTCIKPAATVYNEHFKHGEMP